MGSMPRGKKLTIMNNCPYRLEVDYMVLKKTLRELEETSQQLLNKNQYLWNHLN